MLSAFQCCMDSISPTAQPDVMGSVPGANEPGPAEQETLDPADRPRRLLRGFGVAHGQAFANRLHAERDLVHVEEPSQTLTYEFESKERSAPCTMIHLYDPNFFSWTQIQAELVLTWSVHYEGFTWFLQVLAALGLHNYDNFAKDRRQRVNGTLGQFFYLIFVGGFQIVLYALLAQAIEETLILVLAIFFVLRFVMEWFRCLAGRIRRPISKRAAMLYLLFFVLMLLRSAMVWARNNYNSTQETCYGETGPCGDKEPINDGEKISDFMCVTSRTKCSDFCDPYFLEKCNRGDTAMIWILFAFWAHAVIVHSWDLNSFSVRSTKIFQDSNLHHAPSLRLSITLVNKLALLNGEVATQLVSVSTSLAGVKLFESAVANCRPNQLIAIQAYGRTSDFRSLKKAGILAGLLGDSTRTPQMNFIDGQWVPPGMMQSILGTFKSVGRAFIPFR